jgi:hypothetical protein
MMDVSPAEQVQETLPAMDQFSLTLLAADDIELSAHDQVLTDLDKSSKTVWRIAQSTSVHWSPHPIDGCFRI